MRAAAVAALFLTLALAGCSDGGPPGQTAEDCNAAQSYNEFERRCASSDLEVCRAWIEGDVDPEDAKVSCQVDSDGSAWLDWGFGLTGTAHVVVTDGAGETVHETSVGTGQDHLQVAGKSGAWRLSVDFTGASGSGEVYLWG